MNCKILCCTFLCAVLSATMLSGCGSSPSPVSESLVPDPFNTSGTTDRTISNSVSSSVHIGLDGSSMFSDRDKEIGYDETNSVLISLSDNGSSCSDQAVKIDEGTVTITAEGVYILSGSLSDGQIIVDVDKTEKVQLVLNGIDINCRTSAALYVRQADKVFVTLASGSVNHLSNQDEFVPIDENNIDAVIFSKDDITFNGTGSLTVNAVCGHGIVSKNDLRITGGDYTINAASTALSGKDSVRILDGSFTLTAGKDAVHSENTEEEKKGYIYVAGGSFSIVSGSDGLDASWLLQIEGGSFEIAADDDGAHADVGMIINDGTIRITSCYEGLESATVVINGGEISLTASDDGVNAAGSTNSSDNITINGGILHINASGDGIDSNGSLFVNGGEIYLSGPTDNANSALDYETEAAITGGVLVAAGSSMMAQNFGNASTQGSMLVTFSSYKTAEDQLRLTDQDGNTLVCYTPEKSYNSVVISCPELTVGETYTLSAGEDTLSVEMNELIYGSGMGGRFGGMPPMPGGRGDAPDGMGSAPDGMGDAPDGMGGSPDGMGGSPDGMNGAPDGMDSSHGGMDGFHGDMGGSHGDMGGSHGDMGGSHGDMGGAHGR